MTYVDPSSPTGNRLGLSSVEAAERLRRDGPNVLVPEPRTARIKRWLGPIADPMVALLLLAAPTYFLIGETTDGIVALAALGPVAAVGWLVEARAERTLERLRRLTAPVASVVRDGSEREVEVSDIVVGDVVRVREGDVVPADGVVVDVMQMLVDESALTGESLPIDKTEPDADGTARTWAGTTVLSGTALFRVTATGATTRYGHIGTLLAGAHRSFTPLQRSLARLVRSLSLLAAAFCAAVVAAELLHGGGWGQAVIAGVSLAIAAIPEEFSMVYALYLALGAWRLAQDRALVRRLPSVETLGSTTVICTDKTGTLTHGGVAVSSWWTLDAGTSGSAPTGEAERALLSGAVLASEPHPFDPLDLAIVAAARREGVDAEQLHGRELVVDWPFDPADKYLTHVWARPDDPTTFDVAAKGSFEGVLAHSSVPPDMRARVEAAHAELTASGLRVIAVASGTTSTGSATRRDHEEALVFRGLIAFSDPIRDGVSDALAECRRAGVRVVMITGDHPATAHAVAEGLGLPHDDGAGGDLIATGDDLDGATPERLDDLVARANVFARTRPEHKHLLVSLLRRRGEVVAMTGDGINDAPALREADIGVAMGRRGTDVAREASSLVLLDDNFATIVHAVRDGRRIFDNLTRAFAYLIAFHPPLLLGALVVPLAGQPLLLMPVHLVVLELLLHPIVSLVFQADPASPDAMRRPPRPVGDALRLRSLARPYAVGIVLAIEILAVYAGALAVWPDDQARALAFVTLLAAQPVLLLSMRSPERPFWRSGLGWTTVLTVVVAVLAVTAVAVVHVPPFAELLHLEVFPWWAWSIVVAGAASTAWSEPLKGRHDAARPSER